ncbi:hypothetical protein TNCT_346961 [Trichonephila clavata]|uniref:Uncharacterized protein n=1 Tax=Trichonephila clavata TaxID=2740835 RepID=A0A8X6K716_TRICU|nr:hypothetical protein TNCT_346961 [Trichonephila clavata]
MASRRRLVHIEKSSLDRARQRIMGVSSPSSFEESYGGYTWHVRKVGIRGLAGAPMELEESVLPNNDN